MHTLSSCFISAACFNAFIAVPTNTEIFITLVLLQLSPVLDNDYNITLLISHVYSIMTLGTLIATHDTTPHTFTQGTQSTFCKFKRRHHSTHKFSHFLFPVTSQKYFCAFHYQLKRKAKVLKVNLLVVHIIG